MKALMLALATLLILGGIAVLAFVFLSRPENAPPAEEGTVTFPSSSSGVTETERTYPLMLATGERVLVRNFIANGTTFADPANEGSYYVAGSLPYCLEDGSCPDTNTPAFSILYAEEGQSFSVSLNEEPLRESRTAAEAFLAEALGVSPETLCALTYTVGTTVSVSETYGSYTNLGFSFCPDAVRLP